MGIYINLQKPCKDWTKTEWRWYRNYLDMLASRMDYSIEWVNIKKRVKWINENRL